MKSVLVQAAFCAARAHGTYLQAQFLRLKARRGPKKAAVAVAASILTSCYYILKKDKDCPELGGDYFLRRDKTRAANRLKTRLENLGYDVQITPLPAQPIPTQSGAVSL